MVTVTQRVKEVIQPRGGYLNPKNFEVIDLEMKQSLNTVENVHPILMGLVVDYLTRLILGSKSEDAFKISLKGASNVGELNEAKIMLSKIVGLDDISIINATKMVGYDVAYRKGIIWYKPISEINPDSNTIENIRVMVKRSLDFFKAYGPIVLDGFTLEGGYTKIIGIGDGDFITGDTLWDFKVSVSPPTKDHTLQLLVYYLMGRKSLNAKTFESLVYLGIYNPRLNKIYRLKIHSIQEDIILEVNKTVIGY